MSRRRILLAVNVLAYVFTILINYLSNTGAINGNTVARISAQNQNLFTPLGYAFSIWGLIYLGLLLFVIYLTIQRRKDKKFDVLMRVGNLISVSMILVAKIIGHIIVRPGQHFHQISRQ